VEFETVFTDRKIKKCKVIGERQLVRLSKMAGLIQNGKFGFGIFYSTIVKEAFEYESSKTNFKEITNRMHSSNNVGSIRCVLDGVLAGVA